MPILSQPSFGPRTALIYVTVGSLIDVWTLVWYFTRDSELTRGQQFWVVGLILTGLTFVLLGFFLGHLGRAARRAELPPEDVTPTEAAIQQTAAAHAVAPAAPVVATGAAAPVSAGQVPAAAPPASPSGTVQPRTA